jgi:5-methyltetrahydropteroyltriglutamate--homocysteine methyltransferase
VTAAAKAVGVPAGHVFLPASAPSGVGSNEYYRSDEAYFQALAGELAKEYRAIVDAGLLVQIDDPFLPDIFVDPRLDKKQMRRRAEIYVEATNAALKGIPQDRVRFHTCYGINEGPRIHEAALADIIRYVLKVKASQFSFECANPRHEHEYHLFEKIRIPDGKILCPGVITHASNIVEHPQLIAERLLRFAKLVGRENVMAGADCGFSSQALYRTESIPPSCGRNSRPCARAPISPRSSSGRSAGVRHRGRRRRKCDRRCDHAAAEPAAGRQLA